MLNLRIPLAQLGQAAQAGSPGTAIEPAVAAGLVSWWPEEPTCPVAIRHPLVRDAIYAGITMTRRRQLHARAALFVSEAASWEHRVAALDQLDEDLAAQLEHLAGEEAAGGRLAMAATHLQWASDISPVLADRERRLLTAALHLMLAEESRGLALRQAVEASAPSPLRSGVLGTMAYSSGQLGEAERQFSQALAQARDDPGSQPLAALIANRLASTYTLLGDGEKVMALGRQALDTGTLDPAAASRTRTLVAIGAAQVSGPRAGLAELAYLEADPVRVRAIDVDGLSYRGMLRLLAGDLGQAIGDLTASLGLARWGATLTLGLRAYFYLALAQYLAGAWDDVLLTAEQGLSAAAIHPRRFDLPLLHLAAVTVPAGRGAAEEAERHARLAGEAAASVDYGRERVYAAVARALICQAAGDYPGMADALGPWQDDAALDGRSRVWAVLWRPLLVEGLAGSGQLEQAAAVLAQLRAGSGQVSYLAPALAWLDGWLAEQRGDPELALHIYQCGEDSAGIRARCTKLEGIGFGFLIPVFFIATGVQFDVRALVSNPAALAEVPLFLLALLIVRAVPALTYARLIGKRRASSAGLMQAATLTFVIVASQIGTASGQISRTTGAALLAAGLLSAALFPALAVKLLPAEPAGPAHGADKSAARVPALLGRRTREFL